MQCSASAWGIMSTVLGRRCVQVENIGFWVVFFKRSCRKYTASNIWTAAGTLCSWELLGLSLRLRLQGFCSVSCSSFCNSFPFEKSVFLIGVCLHPSVAGAPLPPAFFLLSPLSSSKRPCKVLQLFGNTEQKAHPFLSFHSCPSISKVRRKKIIRKVFAVYKTPK